MMKSFLIYFFFFLLSQVNMIFIHSFFISFKLWFDSFTRDYSHIYSPHSFIFFNHSFTRSKFLSFAQSFIRSLARSSPGSWMKKQIKTDLPSSQTNSTNSNRKLYECERKNNRNFQKKKKKQTNFKIIVTSLTNPVSYTHLTLPTILLV